MFQYLCVSPSLATFFFYILIVNLILHKSQLQAILKNCVFISMCKGNKHNNLEIMN